MSSDSRNTNQLQNKSILPVGGLIKAKNWANPNFSLPNALAGITNGQAPTAVGATNTSSAVPTLNAYGGYNKPNISSNQPFLGYNSSSYNPIYGAQGPTGSRSDYLNPVGRRMGIRR